MSYKEWFDAHAAKHAAIMEKLAHLSDSEVIEYFRFENMVVHENDFCPLYAQNKKCHEIDTLNCYLCACPHFRFKDSGFHTQQGKTLYSLCSIESPEGELFTTDTAIHQNCTGCIIPHRESYIAKIFNRNWRTLMQNSPTDSILG
ncbi:MAG: hypothetical protein PHW64_06300 [Sulfuricurvum sp.]|nr:hypothetical protein [Sulfuricurvum sp.]